MLELQTQSRRILVQRYRFGQEHADEDSLGANKVQVRRLRPKERSPSNSVKGLV